MKLRSRILRPDLLDDEDLSGVSFGARWLFIWLFALADREGRLRWRTPVVHATVFPDDEDLDLRALLDELSSVGLVRPYRSGRKLILDLPGFLDGPNHQRVHDREAPSALPAFPANGAGWDATGRVADATKRVASTDVAQGKPKANPRSALGPPEASRRHAEGADPQEVRSKKQEAPIKKEDPRARELAEGLAAAIRTHSPELGLSPDRWVRDLDLLLRLGVPGGSASPVDFSEVVRVIRWAHVEDSRGFWRANLLSGKKLRLHFDRLRVESKGSSPKRRPVQARPEPEPLPAEVDTGPALVATYEIDGYPATDVDGFPWVQGPTGRWYEKESAFG